MIFFDSEQILLKMGKLIVEILQELLILISAVQQRCAMLASFWEDLQIYLVICSPY